MKNYPAKLKKIIEQLSACENQDERIARLIEFANRFKSVPSEVAKQPWDEKHKVQFCESGAHVWIEKIIDDNYKFYFAVENPNGIAAKALAVIFDETLSGESSEIILSIPKEVIADIFGEGLSTGKNLGLTGILLMMQCQVRTIGKA